MWKKPYRPAPDITQQYNSGVVKIYTVSDTASPGYKPVEGLSLKETLRYEEIRLGLNRYYQGKQNQVEVAKVIRIPRRKTVSSQDVAIVEDGEQYHIDLIQTTTDVFPPSMDLTLVAVKQKYEVPL